MKNHLKVNENGANDPKNIVVCCDGTSNELEKNTTTNVWKLFDALDNQAAQQVGYYDPGVGTMASSGLRTPAAKRLSLSLGLAFGTGFTRNLEEAYRFLMQEYCPGDQIFVFGFSRGAYAARALAGMVHMFGLLNRDLQNLVPYLTRAYKGANFRVADLVKGSPAIDHDVKVHFLGLWDTVSSLGFAYKRKTFPFTADNPSVEMVRHAIAIDERRAYFRQNRWKRWSRSGQQTSNVKEVWFAGAHSDIGGGYSEESDDRQSKITLHWMLQEAEANGLLIDDHKYKKLFHIEQDSDEVKLDASARIHESLQGLWWILEVLPMNYTLRRRDFFFPLAGRRQIPDDASVHQSVIDRIVGQPHHRQYECVADCESSTLVKSVDLMQAGSTYRPPNLSGFNRCKIEPWHDHVTASVAEMPPDSLKDKSIYVGKAIISVGLFVYFSVFAILFFAPLIWTLLFSLVLGQGWPPYWYDLFGQWNWPIDFAAWTIGPGQFIIAPVLVLVVGSWLIGHLSKLKQFESRVWGPLMHKRAGGYDRQVAESQYYYLRSNGRKAFVNMLKIDLAFSLVYGTVLAWSLYNLVNQTGGLLEGITGLLFLPLVAVVADWIENVVLLSHLPKFDDGAFRSDPKKPQLNASAIQLASLGTVVKICAVTLALLLIVWAQLPWLQAIVNWAIGSGKVFAVPVLVLGLGSIIIARASGIHDYIYRVRGKLLHKLWQGYDDELAEQQMDLLGADGRTAYLKMLRYDLVFPLLYGPALIWALGMINGNSARFDAVSWIMLVPVIAMVADWIENVTLLSQLPKFNETDFSAKMSRHQNADTKQAFDESAIRRASRATTVKIIAITVAFVAIINFVLQPFFAMVIR